MRHRHSSSYLGKPTLPKQRISARVAPPDRYHMVTATITQGTAIYREHRQVAMWRFSGWLDWIVGRFVQCFHMSQKTPKPTGINQHESFLRPPPLSTLAYR